MNNAELCERFNRYCLPLGTSAENVLWHQRIQHVMRFASLMANSNYLPPDLEVQDLTQDTKYVTGVYRVKRQNQNTDNLKCIVRGHCDSALMLVHRCPRNVKYHVITFYSCML